MHLKQKYRSLDAEQVWNLIVKHIKEEKTFQSVTGISYSAEYKNSIFYKGGSGKRSTNGEELSKSDFVTAFKKINSLNAINTNTIKEKIPSAIYRKRTPLIGLLYSAGILEK